MRNSLDVLRTQRSEGLKVRRSWLHEKMPETFGMQLEEELEFPKALSNVSDWPLLQSSSALKNTPVLDTIFPRIAFDHLVIFLALTHCVTDEHAWHVNPDEVFRSEAALVRTVGDRLMAAIIVGKRVV